MSTLQMRVIGLLLVIAIIISFGIASALPMLPHIVYFVLFLALFTISLILFDRRLWSLKFLHKIGLVEHPDISGQWTGELTTSYDQQSKVTDVRVEIKQTWTKLVVHFFAPNSSSVSLSANLFKDETTDDYVLTYIYYTQPYEHGHKTDPPHIGLSVLRLNSVDELSGYYHYYYQDNRDSAFVRGQLVLTRSQDKVLLATVP